MTEQVMWIICPTTGRKFPPIKAFELKDCDRCGGKIDLRYEANCSDSSNRWHLICPPKKVFSEAIK